MKHLIIALKGLFVGGTMLVPGVSGGSMAMILGIYHELIASISSFLKHKKESLLFLGVFVIGALVGMALFARPLEALIERFPMPTLYFFIGAVVGGVPADGQGIGHHFVFAEARGFLEGYRFCAGGAGDCSGV